MYLLKLALRPWRLAPLSQAFSAVVVGFLLLLVGFLFWMQQSLGPILSQLQEEQIVTAYLESGVSEEAAKALANRIRNKLEKDTQLVTAPEFLALLKNQYSQLARELEELGSEMNQVVPRYISISGVLKASEVEEIKMLPGIESIESSKNRYHHMLGALSALRTISRGLVLGLCVALLSGLIHLARMNAFLHREALALLFFWGAGKKALLVPGSLSGLIVGLFGGFIVFTGWLTVGVWMTQQLRSLTPLLRNLAPAHAHLASMLLFLAGILGLIAGVLGSWTYSSQQGGQKRSQTRGMPA